MSRLRLPKRPTDLVMPRWAWVVLAVFTALALAPLVIGLYLWWWVRALDFFGALWFLTRVAGALLLVAGLSACAAAAPRPVCLEAPDYLCRFVVVEGGEPVAVCAPWAPR